MVALLVREKEPEREVKEGGSREERREKVVVSVGNKGLVDCL